MNEKDFREKYYPLAKEQTLETLPQFLAEITKEHFDYGSICCAVAAAAIAAAWSVDRCPSGGITGFQAGAVMWEFIRQWNCSENKTGMRLINYDNMLYEQDADHFEKTISKSTFEALQKEAAKLIEENKKEKEKYDADVIQYKKDLALFKAKYPDYEQDPKKYEKLRLGTGDEWAVEKKKVDSGFEFAPEKPYCPQGQIEHWQSIVDGTPPFGYIVRG